MSAAAASFPSCSGVRTEKTVTLRSHSRSTSATASILCWPCGGPFLLDLWPPHVRSRQARAPLGPRRLRGTAGPDLSPLPGRAPRLGGAPRRLPKLREHQAFRHAGGRGLPGVRTRHRRGVTGVPASRTASPSAPDTVGSRRVLILGLAGLAAFSAFFLIRPLFGPDPYGPRPAGTTYAYSFLVVAAFVPYAAAVWAVRRGVSLRVAIAGTILLHGLLLPAALTQSQDLYMYLFYGKMWAVHGANPYLVEPQAFASLAGELQRALQGPLGETPSAALVRVGGLVVVVLVIVLHARSPTFREDPWPAAAAAFLAYFLVTPWFLYWHQAGLLALAAAAATVSVRASAYTFSATSMLTTSLGGSPWGRGLQAALRYGPPLALLGRRRISS